jgi:predicted outer membrane repeat protein
MKSLFYSALIFFLLLHLSPLTKAQTVTIYRSGVALTPTYSSIKGAVANSIDNDSLVLSADTFREQNIIIDKSLIMEGSGSVSVRSTIDPGLAADSSVFKFINSDFPVVTRTLSLRNMDIINGYANNGLDSGGGAIFAGRGTILKLNGLINIANNRAPDSSAGFAGSRNGGAIYSEGEVHVTSYDVVFENNSAVNGGAIYSTNKLVLDFWVKLKNSTASLNGGAIYTSGILYILGESVLFASNAVNGGGCYAENAELYIKGNSRFDLNHVTKLGGGLFLKNTYCIMSDSVEFYGNQTDSNIAAVMYCTGNNDVQISGANFIYNRCTNMTYTGSGMTVYNDAAPGASSIFRINNSRIFNPKFDNSRQNEFYNAQAVSAFLSDSSWWGESDTAGLIYNVPSATVGFRSWIVCEWTLNGGLPVDTANSFPLEAYFKLYTGAAIPSKMFWMLSGYFSSDSGAFSPSVVSMPASNIVGSVFSVPLTTGGVNLLATVDADTFKKAVYVHGTGITEHKIRWQRMSIFPNPATDIITINCNEIKEGWAKMKITDISGRALINESIHFSNSQSRLPLNLLRGYYILEIATPENKKYSQQLIVQ